ncbi:MULTISPECIES: oligopeptide:H+ symporter [unclassified Pseudoxanthomonas]|uniref:POT-type proton-dependent oligopeptide transporter n=1 Tax=unclassified Pseudoxanthomonas TaxID=2645906 RepID=UPI0016091AEF|nr:MULTISPECIES: oligopeptide:H+ symporter [unclassified Pseudoxanthomonas]MBB3277037.1 POT family proton-dependent oligopeptide transporter [Pseudoxanthomonas sp. OG2]MBV7475672.1 oligopeptide:H+ symporter [Pseudoxanthomonas sp. PXM05]
MTTSSEATAGRLPRQIPYIIGNEACERFSFYGMRNILVQFLASSILLAYLPEAERQGVAKDVFHSFVIGVYFFPLLGGWLSDRYFGKYNTVLWFSLIYCAGHACLALFESHRTGFYTGLFLIALGSGGIKPLVVSFVGDQFDQSNKNKAKIVFDAFYWTINFGSFFASLLMPLFLRSYGPAVAFGIPGILMFIATFIFWLGRKQYVNVPPSGEDPDSFLRVVRTALAARREGEGRWGYLVAMAGVVIAVALLVLWALSMLGLAPGWWPDDFGFVISACLALGVLIAFGGWGASMQLERARGRHPDAAVDSVRAVLRILIVFALVTPFWSLFDQKASTWVLQGKEMVMPEGAWWWPGWLIKDAGQLQALNPAMVMLLIPFNNLVLYPALRKLGFEPTPLRRMGWGIAFSGLAWVVAGTLQLWMDGGDPVSLAWQILPYALLTFGEILVSATALEFAYSQATQAMKGVIMAFWYLTSTFGSLWVLLTNAGVRNDTVTAHIASTGLSENAFLMFFFAGFAFLAALVFALYARSYPMQDNYRAV